VGGTHIKFGSIGDGTTNDLIAALTFPMTISGNSVAVTLTNTGAANGYLNYLRILGNGIYTYEPVVVAEEDATSIAARGERLLTVKLEQVRSTNLAQTYADFLLAALKGPGIRIDRVRFLANFSDDYATAALTVEPNTRFSIKEAQTGADAALFACRLRFAQEDTLLWVEIVPGIPLGGANITYFVWDLADHGWDEGAWAF
jgi:hypothetical protein